MLDYAFLYCAVSYYYNGVACYGSILISSRLAREVYSYDVGIILLYYKDSSYPGALQLVYKTNTTVQVRSIVKGNGNYVSIYGVN